MCACYFEINSSDAIAVFAAILAVESAFLFFALPTFHNLLSYLSKYFKNIYKHTYYNIENEIKQSFLIFAFQLVHLIIFMLFSNFQKCFFTSIGVLLFIIFFVSIHKTATLLIKFLTRDTNEIIYNDVKVYLENSINDLKKELQINNHTSDNSSKKDEYNLEDLFNYEQNN